MPLDYAPMFVDDWAAHRSIARGYELAIELGLFGTACTFIGASEVETG